MQLIEQHIIRPGDERFAAIDLVCFKSKNLYNAANYRLRQEFMTNQRYMAYGEFVKQMHTQPEYAALPAKVAQHVLTQVDEDWQNYLLRHRMWQAHPERFKNRPALPKYKHKSQGRNKLIYTLAQLDSQALQQGEIVAEQLGIRLKTKQEQVYQVRLIPRDDYYLVEVVASAKCVRADVENHRYAALYIRLNNLATLTATEPGFVPRLFNGKPLKAINQYFNKQCIALLDAVRNGNMSNNMAGNMADNMAAVQDAVRQLKEQRDRRIRHYLHCTSRQIIDLLVKHGIGNLIIGKNSRWEQRHERGRSHCFISVPFIQFIDMLVYKAKLVGIQPSVISDSYVAQCSFLDLEQIGHHEHYEGRRLTRGLFRSRSGTILNADVNSSYNLMRKVLPDAWTREGIADAVVHPSSMPLST